MLIDIKDEYRNYLEFFKFTKKLNSLEEVLDWIILDHERLATKEAILQGLEDIKNGKVYTMEEVKNLLDKNE